MEIGLIKMISTQKHSKAIINRVQNSTFWALITPPNLHIASPLAMKERKKERAYKTIIKLCYKKVAVQKGCEEVMLNPQ